MNPTDQTHIILAIVLLQTLGLFHRRKNDEAVSPTIYHTMLITVRLLL